MTAPVTKCIFCDIIKENAPDVILYQDDELVIIKDKYPIAKFHLLVLPKRHIENAKSLQNGDAKLIEKMNEKGLDQLRKMNADMNDFRSGFNWPPTNTISHLHQHLISPGESLRFPRSFFFSQRNWFFVNTEYILKRLAKF